MKCGSSNGTTCRVRHHADVRWNEKLTQRGVDHSDGLRQSICSRRSKAAMSRINQRHPEPEREKGSRKQTKNQMDWAASGRQSNQMD